jgi:hypothetical protein
MRSSTVLFLLSTAATASIYRIVGNRFRLLASFRGDRVVIAPGTVTVGFENRGRSPHGEIEDIYRFQHGHYRLVSRT